MKALSFKNIFTILATCLIAVRSITAATYTPQFQPVTLNFNRGWLFNNTDNATFSGGAALVDASWTKVCLPQQNITIKHAFFKWRDHLYGNWSGMLLPLGTASITLLRLHPAAEVLLEFEGVATVATVYVNGTLVGTHQGAYTPIYNRYNQPPDPRPGHVIAVAGQFNQANPGSRLKVGISIIAYSAVLYANVHLIVCDPLHVQWNWGLDPKLHHARLATPNGIVTFPCERRQ